jgi:phage gp37-like protein
MIAAIENAIIAALSAAQWPWRPRVIESYAGQLDDDSLDSVLRAFPAVWVAYAGSPAPKHIGARKWRVDAKFAVMVGAQHLREQAARQGSTADVGTYRMLADVQAALLYRDFGLAIDFMKPGAIRTLYNTRVAGQGLSVMSQDWSTAFIAELPAPGATPGADWLRTGFEYFLQPGDAVADASDTLTMSQG